LCVGYPDAAGTTAEGPAEGPDADGCIVSWCWHRPGRVGWLTPDGPREVVVGPASMTGLEPGDAAVMLTIGSMWSGSGLVPAAGPMSTWTPRFAIWPRVLTRRERMSIGALWRRELRA